MFQNLSLRQKLLSTIGLAGLLASLPVIYLSHNAALERSINQSTMLFSQQVRLLNELVEIDYLESVSSTAAMTIADHEVISSLASAVTRVYLASVDYVDVVKTFQKSLSEHGIDLMVTSGTEAILPNDRIQSLLIKNIKDYRGVSVREILQQDSVTMANSQFTTVRYDSTGPKMFGVWHLPNQESLLLMKSSSDRERKYQDIESSIIKQVRETLLDLPLQKDSSLALISSSGRVLASAGVPFPQDFDPKSVFASKTGADHASGFATKGNHYLYSVYRFKPYDWYISAVISERAVIGPAWRSSLLLIAFIMGAFLLIGMLTAYYLNRTLKPLTDIAERAERLSKVDFSAQTDFADKLLKGFTYSSKDEIGRLSNAFAHMIRELDTSIDKLKTTLVTQQRMEGELNAGHDIQRSILTVCDSPFTADGFEAFAFMEPAKEVAGDLYDVMTTPDGRQALIVGDVSGKGVSAALFMSMTITLIRYAVSEGYGPAQIMQRVNDQLAGNNPTCMFVTLWIGFFDPKSGEITFANGGHCAPAVIAKDSDKPVRWIEALSGPVVGPIEGIDFSEEHDRLEVGETCLIYTDGVSEAMNEDGKLYGEERIGRIMEQNRNLTPEELIQSVMDSVLDYRGTAQQSDDITMLSFTRKAF